jgi:hypothetical protein
VPDELGTLEQARTVCEVPADPGFASAFLVYLLAFCQDPVHACPPNPEPVCNSSCPKPLSAQALNLSYVDGWRAALVRAFVLGFATIKLLLAADALKLPRKRRRTRRLC